MRPRLSRSDAVKKGDRKNVDERNRAGDEGRPGHGAPAPTQASVIAPSPSATSPSIGAARRLISAKSRTIAAEWVGTVSGRLRARQTRAKGRSASGGPPWIPDRAGPSPRRALNSLITARYAPPHALFNAVQIINDPLT